MGTLFTTSAASPPLQVQAMLHLLHQWDPVDNAFPLQLQPCAQLSLSVMT